MQAAHLFAVQGFRDTVTADVAKAAGVSHGTVFAHFSSREALVAAAAHQMCRMLTDAMHRVVGDGRSLAEVLQAHLDAITENQLMYLRLLREHASLPVGLRTQWIGIQSAVATYIIEAAAREKQLKPMPQHMLFNTWIGLVHHYLLNEHLFAPSGGVLACHGPALIDFFSNLIRRSP